MLRSLRLFLAIVAASCAAVTPALAQSVLLGNGTAASPSLRFNNSPTTGMFRFGPDSIGWATSGATSLRLLGGANVKILGGDGSMTIQAGTGASRTLSLSVTSSGGTATTPLILADGLVVSTSAARIRMGNNGSATDPTLHFTNMQGAGLWGVGTSTADSLRFSTDSLQTLSLSGGASATLVGGAGNMTIQAGTGNSRTMTLQTTTNAGTAKNTLVLGADTSVALVSGGRLTLDGAGGNTWLANTAGADTLNMTTGGSQGPKFAGGRIIAGGTGSAADPALRMTASGAVYGLSVTNLVGGGGDTLQFSLNAQRGLGLVGGSGSTTVLGGAGNMTIQAGTGNSRTMTLQSTTSAGTAKNTLVLGADSSATFLGNIRVRSTSTGGVRVTDDADNIAVNVRASGGNGLLNLRDANANSTFELGNYGDSTLTVAGFGAQKRARFHVVTGRAELSDSLLLATATGTPSGNAFVRGGAGNMTIQAGTGNSRTMTLQGTTATGVAKSILKLGQSTSAFGRDTNTIAIGRYLSTYTPADCSSGPTFGADVASNIGFSVSGTTATRMCVNGFDVAVAQETSMSFPQGRFVFDTSGKLTGSARNMTIQAGTGNARTLSLQSTNGTGVVKTPLQIGSGSNGDHLVINPATTVDTIVSQPLFYEAGNAVHLRVQSTNAGGHEARVTISSTDASGSARLYIDSPGAQDIQFQGAGAVGITGGTSNMTVTAGSGNNRSLTLRGTTNAGTANPFLVGVADTLKVSNEMIATSLTAASGTPNSVCIVAATKQFVENAASNCTVSSARFKTDIMRLDPGYATRSVMAMEPVSFTMKDGGRLSLGLIAEKQDSIDARLAFKNADGTVNSYDQSATLAMLIATVQQLRRDNDALRARVDSLSKGR